MLVIDISTLADFVASWKLLMFRGWGDYLKIRVGSTLDTSF